MDSLIYLINISTYISLCPNVFGSVPRVPKAQRPRAPSGMFQVTLALLLCDIQLCQ